jgi:two-component system sensor histidine kinase KdpD
VVQAFFSVPDIEMLFLLGVMIAAITCGRGASILASFVAVVAYDFFFVPPAFTLAVADVKYLLTFFMMFGVSVVMGTLARRLRDQQQAAVGRERTTSALYALSRELGAALDARGVAEVCARAVADAFDADVVLLARRERDDLSPLAASPREVALGPADLAVARRALERGLPAGVGTDALPDERVLCVPLRTFGEVLAVLVLRPSRTRGLTAPQRSFLEALIRQTALALDRVALADEARRAALRAKTEELRSGLLSAVSHDLRTPLAAITGAGTMLRDEATLDPALRRELVETVCDEAERLERLVSNLLDMTRLDSGAVEPRREWVPLDEVIGSALTRLERRLAGRPVTTRIADDVPLLRIDPVLVEQLFLNLLENAAKYTPPGSPIEIRATREGGTIVVEVADRGPGLPADAEERIFERFFRGAHATVRGVGLGLPISRAIAQAHGGRLAAANRPGGGAVFRLTLPLPADVPPGTGEAADAAGGSTE